MRYWFVFTLFLPLLAQAQAPDGGGALPAPGDANPHPRYEAVLWKAHQRARQWDAERGPSLQADHLTVPLQWPVRESIGASGETVQGISNFVDQDASENNILDFNCGDRTYDGHRGTDVFISPYSWYKMERDEGIVIAAAPGRIVEKVQDEPERSCSSTNPTSDNNVIVLEHDDGSLALYAHMRTDSLTKKPLGARVETGEYLGVIGSSGYSTGPHLHFEVGRWELETDMYVWRHQDPYAGSCNGLNDETWWAAQPTYYESRLKAIATHGAAPVSPACPQTETPNYQDVFSAGATIYFAAYYRDQLAGQDSTFVIRRPNGSVFTSWTHASPEPHYASSYWYWSLNMPSGEATGKWRLEVTFQGGTLTHDFWIGDQPEPPPVMPEANNAYNGLWYDPALDGEGYNIVTFSQGTVIYFYGNDARGRRLWLTSDVLTDVIRNGQEIVAEMYVSSGGVHDAPMGSARGLAPWGQLRITFTACDAAVATLEGVDGSKVSQMVKLTGVTGTDCIGGTSADANFSGLWYDPALEGEGYNVVVTPFGLIVYYYGFDADGELLWLLGGPFNPVLQAGEQYQLEVFKATTGTFDNPVASNQALVSWGTLSLNVRACNDIEMSLLTQEGDKLSEAIQIVSVVGVPCE